MKVEYSTVTKLRITGAAGLDPITAIMEDLGPGRGKLMLECFGDSWSHLWNAMGTETLREFIRTASCEYLASKLCRQPERVTDWETITQTIGCHVSCEVDALNEADQMRVHYGEDWRMELPTRMSNDWQYVRRIVEALKTALAAPARAA